MPTGRLPRVVLYLLWAGEALVDFASIGRFMFIRMKDVASRAIIGILVRILFGIDVGLLNVLVLWFLVGHIAIGFWFTDD